MKAMILAAGLGTRLKPLTGAMPKALVPIGGKPLLQHVIGKLKAAGFDEIIINLHHFPEQIIAFVEANNHFGIRVEFSHEREELLDTGGAIKKASWFFDDDKPFLVHNVDILSNFDLRKLYEAHLKDTPLVTLVCSERETSRHLLFDYNNRLKGWVNDETGEVKSPFPGLNPLHYRKLAYAGIQILQPSVFRLMEALPERFPIIGFYLSICDAEELACHIPDNPELIDVGKTGSLKEAARFAARLPS